MFASRSQGGPPKAFFAWAAIAVLVGGLAVLGPDASVARAQTAPLAGNHPEAAHGELNAPRPVSPDMELRLKFVFALRNRAALDKLLAEQQNTKSPEYHHWLTPGEFTARFGPRESDLEAVAGWLRQEGLKVVSADLGDRYVVCTGTASQAARTLGVTIVASADGRFFGNLADPMIPARFVGVISHIDGLDNLRRIVPMIRKSPGRGSGADPATPVWAGFKPVAFVEGSIPAPPSSEESHPEVVVGGVRAFGPSDLRTFYDEQPLFGSGVTGGSTDCIAVAEDSDYLDAAVNLFVSQFGLAAISITRVFPDSGSPGTNGDESEALLDIEWAHAAAPGTPLRAYIGNQATATIDSITDSIKKAVSDNACGEVSISFGFCGENSSFYTGILDPIFKQAASQGQSVFVSSGDDGAAGLVLQGSSCVPGTSRNVNELSADPYVTSVGGTEFTPKYDGSGNDDGFVPEDVWDEPALPPPPGGAGGGGASAIFSKPTYQSGVTPADGKRDVPDVAMIASPDMPGVFLGDDNGGSAVIDCCWGGTSLAAPLWAAITNLAAQQTGARQGNINPYLYRTGALPNASTYGIRDVTSGNNSLNGVTGFSAGPGYDQATGWGSVDIAGFVLALNGTVDVTLQYHPNNLNFPKEVELGGNGKTSPEKKVFIVNPRGTRKHPGVPVTIKDFAVSGPFATVPADSTCTKGGVIAAGARCVVALTFTPTAPGPVTGSSLTVTTNALNNPTVALNGRGVQGALIYRPHTLNFGKVKAGATSASKEVTLINRNPVAMSISGINVSGSGFNLGTSSNPCGATLGPGATCKAAVTFTASAPPAKQIGTLTIADDAVGSPQTVSLTGVSK